MCTIGSSLLGNPRVATLRACLIVLRMLLAIANWEDKLIGWLYFGVLHIGWSYLSLSATLFSSIDEM